MSGHQTLIKIGVACVAIVLGAIFVGSQLSTGGKFMGLVPKAGEEDEAGAFESVDADDADAGSVQDEDAAEAENADESDADEEATEEDVASDESEGDDASEGEEAAEDGASKDEGASGDEDVAEDETEEDGGGTDQASDSRGPGGVAGGSGDNGFGLIRGNR